METKIAIQTIYSYAQSVYCPESRTFKNPVLTELAEVIEVAGTVPGVEIQHSAHTDEDFYTGKVRTAHTWNIQDTVNGKSYNLMIGYDGRPLWKQLL